VSLTRPTSPTRHRTIPHAIPLAVLAGLAGLSIGLTGCGDQDDAQAAVEDAYTEVTQLGGGASSASAEYADRVYTELVSALNSPASSDSPHAAYAQISLANAKTGVAQAPLAAARDAAAQITRQLRLTRSTFSEWQRWNARAEAASMVDVAAEIASLQAQSGEVAEAMSAARSALAQTQQQIAALRSESEDLLRRSKALRDEAAEIELEAASRSAVEAAEAAPRIRGLSREADGLEKDALLIATQADLLEPIARDRQLEIDRLTELAQLLDSRRTELRQREQNAKAEAADARAEAASLEESLNAGVADLRSLYTQDFLPAHERGERTLSEAASTIGRARDAGEIATIASAVIKLQQADAANLLADTQADLASVLGPMQAAGVIAGDAQFATGLAEQTEENYERARSAYADAADAFGRIRSRDHAESLEALSNSLQMRSETIGMTPSVTGDTSDESMESGATDARNVEGFDSPESAAQALLDAGSTGEWAPVLSAVQLPMGSQGLTDMMVAMTDLEAACHAEFGTGIMSEMNAQAGAMGGEAGPLSQAIAGQVALDGLTLDDLAIDTGDESAVISLPDGTEIELARTDAGWLFTMPETQNMAAQMSMMPAGMLEAIAGSTNDIAAKVRNGDFDSTADVLAALQQAMMSSMGGGTGGMNGG
jgi:hypothetical protein